MRIWVLIIEDMDSLMWFSSLSFPSFSAFSFSLLLFPSFFSTSLTADKSDTFFPLKFKPLPLAIKIPKPTNITWLLALKYSFKCHFRNSLILILCCSEFPEFYNSHQTSFFEPRHYIYIYLNHFQNPKIKTHRISNCRKVSNLSYPKQSIRTYNLKNK